MKQIKKVKYTDKKTTEVSNLITEQKRFQQPKERNKTEGKEMKGNFKINSQNNVFHL